MTERVANVRCVAAQGVGAADHVAVGVVGELAGVAWIGGDIEADGPCSEGLVGVEEETGQGADAVGDGLRVVVGAVVEDAHVAQLVDGLGGLAVLVVLRVARSVAGPVWRVGSGRLVPVGVVGVGGGVAEGIGGGKQVQVRVIRVCGGVAERVSGLNEIAVRVVDHSSRSHVATSIGRIGDGSGVSRQVVGVAGSVAHGVGDGLDAAVERQTVHVCIRGRVVVDTRQRVATEIRAGEVVVVGRVGVGAGLRGGGVGDGGQVAVLIVGVGVDVALRVSDLGDAVLCVAHEGYVEAGGAGNAVGRDGQAVARPVVDGLQATRGADVVGSAVDIGVGVLLRVEVAAPLAGPHVSVGDKNADGAVFVQSSERAVETWLRGVVDEVVGEQAAKGCARRHLWREVEGAALTAKREGDVAHRIDHEVNVDAEVPAVAEVAARAGVEAVVGALDANWQACSGNHKVSDGGGKAAGLVVASNGHKEQILLRISRRIGSVELNPVGPVGQHRCVELGDLPGICRNADGCDVGEVAGGSVDERGASALEGFSGSEGDGHDAGDGRTVDG